MNYPRNPQRRMNNFNETAQNRQRNGYGQNKPGKYEPGKATLRPNNDKRGPRDPDNPASISFPVGSTVMMTVTRLSGSV